MKGLSSAQFSKTTVEYGAAAAGACVPVSPVGEGHVTTCACSSWGCVWAGVASRLTQVSMPGTFECPCDDMTHGMPRCPVGSGPKDGSDLMVPPNVSTHSSMAPAGHGHAVRGSDFKEIRGQGPSFQSTRFLSCQIMFDRMGSLWFPPRTGHRSRRQCVSGTEHVKGPPGCSEMVTPGVSEVAPFADQPCNKRGGRGAPPFAVCSHCIEIERLPYQLGLGEEGERLREPGRSSVGVSSPPGGSRWRQSSPCPAMQGSVGRTCFPSP